MGLFFSSLVPMQALIMWGGKRRAWYPLLAHVLNHDDIPSFLCISVYACNLFTSLAHAVCILVCAHASVPSIIIHKYMYF